MPDEQPSCSRDIQRCGARTYLELLVAKEAAVLANHVQHERELRQTDEQRVAETLRLQAIEYERRLGALDTMYLRVAIAQQTYISKETFEDNLKQQEIWRQDSALRIERTATALPAYVTREGFEAAMKAENLWKADVMGRLEKAASQVAGYLPREVYEASQVANQAFHTQVSETLATAKGSYNTIIIVMGIVFSIATLASRLL